MDETATAGRVLHADLRDTLNSIQNGESNPPLHYLLAWVWSKIFGTGEVGLRSLSALAGVAAVPVLYATGTTLCSRRVGLVAAALAATSPMLVWYSQEARPYSLLVLLSAASLLLLVRAVEQPSRRRLLSWAAVGALAIATHYFALLLVLPEALWLLYRERRGDARLAVGLIALCGLALLPLAWKQASGSQFGWIGRADLGSRLEDWAERFLIMDTDGFDEPAVAAAGALFALAAGLVLWKANQLEQRAAALAVGFGGLVVLLPLALEVVGVHYFVAKNLLPALPLLLLAAGTGFGAAGAGRVGLAAATALCALGIALVVNVALTDSLQRTDWRAAAQAVGPPDQDRVVVAQDPTGGLQRYGRLEEWAGSRVAGVREVVFLAQDGEITPPPRLPRAFRRVDRRRVPGFEVITLRSPRPISLPMSALARTGSQGRNEVLVPAT